MNNTFRLVQWVAIFSALMTVGCGTIASRIGEDRGDGKPYGGARWLVTGITGDSGDSIFYLDLPLTLVGDTLLLPYDCSKRD